MTWIPTIEYILALFEDQIAKPRLMNRSGLAGTLDKVRWGIPFQGTPTIWDRVTILFTEIVQNHYFFDGNKRIGTLIAYIFLAKNGLDFSPPKGEIFSITMAVAQGQKNFNEIHEWFEKNTHENK